MAGISVGKSLLTCSDKEDSSTDPIIIVHDTFSGTCTYTSPQTTCNASTVVPFSIENYIPFTTPFAQLVSGTSLSVVKSPGNQNGVFTFSRVGNSQTTSVYRIGLSTDFDIYYSSSFTITLTAEENTAAPTISVTGGSSGSCSYTLPDINCSASVVKNYTVTNYSNGTTSIEHVSGTNISSSKSGSNSSGSFTFSRSGSAATVSGVFRIALATTSGTFYSSNFTITLTATAEIAAVLRVWIDFNNVSSRYTNAVNSNLYTTSNINSQQSTALPVSTTLGSHHSVTLVGSQGSGSYPAIQFNNTNYSLITSSNQSINFWFKSNGVADGDIRVFEAANGWTLRMIGGTNGIKTFRWSPTPTGTDTLIGSLADSTVVNNNWAMYTITFTVVSGNSKTIRFYKNGSLIGTHSHATSIIKPNVLMRPAWNSEDNNYTIAMDSFAMWDKILSSVEISHLYNSGQGRTYATL